MPQGYKRNWLDKLITHNQDKVGDFGSRVVVHIPIGFITALILLVHWVMVLAFVYIFWHYERNEDAHSQDEAWKDLYGFLVGFILGATALFIWRQFAND